MFVLVEGPFHLEILLPERILQILRRNFPEEAAGGVALMLSVAHTSLRESERNGCLRPRQGHIEQAALLFQLLLREHPAAGGEEVFLHA